MEKKLSEKSPVQNLQESINQVIALQAKNLLLIARGEEPLRPIDAKSWDAIVKIVEIMPKFKVFESICDEESGNEAKNGDSSPKGNTFEERSKAIKAKINGETVIGTKGD